MCDGFALEVDVDALHTHVWDLEVLAYDLQDKVTRLERALKIMLAEPGSPHSSAADARAALRGE